MIRLNYGCDKRVRYCVLIFVLDIVPSVSTIQLDLKKPACGWTDELARSLTKKYRVGHKSAIFEKGHRPILIKITFLESAHHQLSNGICRFFWAFHDLPTNRAQRSRLPGADPGFLPGEGAKGLMTLYGMGMSGFWHTQAQHRRYLLPYYASMVLNNHSRNTSPAFGAGPSVPGVGAGPTAPPPGSAPASKSHKVSWPQVAFFEVWHRAKGTPAIRPLCNSQCTVRTFFYIGVYNLYISDVLYRWP